MSGYGEDDGYYNDMHARQGVRRYLPPAVKYLLALVLLVVFDAFWMQLFAPKALGIDYFSTVESIQSSPMAKRWLAGLVAYLVLGYAAAFMTQAASPERSLLQGAKVGFVIYAVFDCTTTFMFHAWGPKIAICDIIWGTLMYAVIGYLLAFLETTSLWQRL